MGADSVCRGRLAVWAGCMLVLTGCAEHELAVSVQERGSVAPKTVAVAPTPAPPPAPAATTVPPPAPIAPPVEERVASEPLPPPPTSPPLPATRPPREPREDGVPFLLDIPFDFDQAKLRDEAVAMVEVNASRLQEKGGWSLTLEGHCDEVGTTEYNLVLGERRVQAVKQYLVRLGLPESSIEGISYGKERPLCTEHTAECWQKNRIVRFELQ